MSYSKQYWSVLKRYPLSEVLSLTPIAHKKRSLLRSELLNNMSQCLVTGWNNPKECECAHIVPKSYGYNMKFPDVDQVDNCCLLSNGIHALFDDMQWTLDIYHFLNREVTDETSFDATIISLNTGKRSILNSYKKTVITVPVSKYPSFMMHYYAYHLYHYTTANDLGKIYKRIWNSGMYQELKKCETTSQLKTLLLRKRQRNDGLYSVLCILGQSRSLYRVLWDYYDYSHITNEPVDNIENTEAYDEYEHLTDPSYMP